MTEFGTRRGFLIGALALMTAPAIVRVDSLMKIMPIDVYDTRCLVRYSIERDDLILRIDRSLRRLKRPDAFFPELDVKTARAIFGDHPIFTAEPFNRVTGVESQLVAWRSVTSDQLRAAGVLI